MFVWWWFCVRAERSSSCSRYNTFNHSSNFLFRVDNWLNTILIQINWFHNGITPIRVQLCWTQWRSDVCVFSLQDRCRRPSLTSGGWCGRKTRQPSSWWPTWWKLAGWVWNGDDVVMTMCFCALVCYEHLHLKSVQLPFTDFLRVGGPDFLGWSKCVCVFIGWCECVSFLRPCLKFRWVCEIDSLRITCWVNDAFWASSMWTGQKLINGAHYQTAVKWHKPPYLQTDRQRNAAVDIMWL